VGVLLDSSAFISVARDLSSLFDGSGGLTLARALSSAGALLPRSLSLSLFLCPIFILRLSPRSIVSHRFFSVVLM